jgi:hypothetical protein
MLQFTGWIAARRFLFVGVRCPVSGARSAARVGVGQPAEPCRPVGLWNQVKTRLEFLAQHHGVGLVTGEVGAGKSTGARVFTARLNSSLHKILHVHFSWARRWTYQARSP